jgi:hypothetical protein
MMLHMSSICSQPIADRALRQIGIELPPGYYRGCDPPKGERDPTVDLAILAKSIPAGRAPWINPPVGRQVTTLADVAETLLEVLLRARAGLERRRANDPATIAKRNS